MDRDPAVQATRYLAGAILDLLAFHENPKVYNHLASAIGRIKLALAEVQREARHADAGGPGGDVAAR